MRCSLRFAGLAPLEAEDRYRGMAVMVHIRICMASWKDCDGMISQSDRDFESG